MVQMLYILGSTRSGTSALRNAIAETRFAGYGEGHLVPMLQNVLKAVHEVKTEGVGFDTKGTGLAAFKEQVFARHFFFAYEMYLKSEIGSAYIVDKTPTIEPIIYAPTLRTLHQDAKFIHCSRRHVDNVLSKQKKFPGESVEHHATEWARCNEAWLETRRHLEGEFLEFDFFDLTNSTIDISSKIGEYLDLTPDEVALVEAYLISKRPQANPDRDVKQFSKLSETPWTKGERDAFISICAPVAEKLGYGMEDYFA